MTESEYAHTRAEVREGKKRLEQHRSRCVADGMTDEQTRAVMDPMVSFHLGLEEEVAAYEREMAAKSPLPRPEEQRRLMRMAITHYMEDHGLADLASFAAAVGVPLEEVEAVIVVDHGPPEPHPQTKEMVQCHDEVAHCRHTPRGTADEDVWRALRHFLYPPPGVARGQRRV